jgi:hypothetical protein
VVEDSRYIASVDVEPLLPASRSGPALLETRSGGRQAVDLCRRQLPLLTRWTTADSWPLTVAVLWGSTQALARAWPLKVLGYREPRSGLSTRNKAVVCLKESLEERHVVGTLLVEGYCR